MKKISVILTAVLIVLAGSSFQASVAQDKTKEEKEKELKIQQEIDEQKRELIEQKRIQEDVTRAMEKALKEANEKLEESERYRDVFRNFYVRPDNRPFSTGEPIVVTPDLPSFLGRSLGGSDSERTSWELSRSVKESTFSKSYSFDVEKSAKTVTMSINGDCKSGEIRVAIIMPGGKTYSDILIDEFGNLNWRKSFTISEEENKDKMGEWVFKISAKDATGQFRISLQTY
jgi:hypothetical protein